MDPEEFTYEDGQWVEHEGGGDWPFWIVTGRLYDVDDGSPYYRMSWQHPRTREYREEYVPGDAALEDFEAVEEEKVEEAVGIDPSESGPGAPGESTSDPESGSE